LTHKNKRIRDLTQARTGEPLPASHAKKRIRALIHAPTIVYQLTADDLVRLADEIAPEAERMEKRIKKMARLPRDDEKAREHTRLIDLIRSDPARLAALDLRIAVSFKQAKEMEGMSPASQRAKIVRMTACEINMRLAHEDPRLRAMIMGDPERSSRPARATNVVAVKSGPMG
jgi:hypothetical protein